MLCQKCKKKTADYYYKQVINGHSSELALCSDCARAMKSETGFNFGDLGFNHNFLGSNLLEGLFLPDDKAPRKKEPKTCPLCGSTFSDIAARGKVGCAKCYETFADELEPTIASVHGRAVHCGRKPAKNGN
ncbi:MAG: hypothetical protein PUE85_06605 [Firmicutes bacterium]|nr:hypothetical protein [Bacillota bacterium]